MAEIVPIEPTPKGDPVLITEDEAALYDRQIRLWGLEAQQKMRNATILVVRLKGTATETIKNIVLAGIGKLVIVDDENVSAVDLGAGFFFRDEDVGKKRVDVARARVQALNPLVTIETVSDENALSSERFDILIREVDLVCVTDWDRNNLIKLNSICRTHGKPFYAGGTYGLLGYIFCDLLAHDYISPDKSAGTKDGVTKNVKLTATYPTLSDAIDAHSWSGLTRRQTKELNPAIPFAILALWEYQHQHGGALPSELAHSQQLIAIAQQLVTSAEVNKQALPDIPVQLIESLSTTAAHEFSPVCAVVGGMLAQDILKALAAREAPIANFLSFDGNTGGSTVVRMGMTQQVPNP